MILALAYFVAELWHGPSSRTWLLGPHRGGRGDHRTGAMWLLSPAAVRARRRRRSVNPGSQACPAVIPDVVLTVADAGRSSAVVVAVGIVLVAAGSLRVQREA